MSLRNEVSDINFNMCAVPPNANPAKEHWHDNKTIKLYAVVFSPDNDTS